MADDVTLPGDGSVVATDEVDGRHYQLVKLVVGGEGEASLLSRDSPQPVVDEIVELMLRQVLARLNSPTGYDANLNRGRVTAILESGTVSSVTSVSTVSTISTLSTVSNLVSLNNTPSDVLVIHQARSAWASNVRSLVT